MKIELQYVTNINGETKAVQTRISIIESPKVVLHILSLHNKKLAKFFINIPEDTAFEESIIEQHKEIGRNLMNDLIASPSK